MQEARGSLCRGADANALLASLHQVRSQATLNPKPKPETMHPWQTLYPTHEQNALLVCTHDPTLSGLLPCLWYVICRMYLSVVCNLSHVLVCRMYLSVVCNLLQPATLICCI
jgi:hypothetical protein